MSEKTYEISFTAIFTAYSTNEMFDIIKSIQSSEIILAADECNINANIIVSNNNQEGDQAV